jgi:hypothetical protein
MVGCRFQRQGCRGAPVAARAAMFGVEDGLGRVE